MTILTSTAGAAFRRISSSQLKNDQLFLRFGRLRSTASIGAEALQGEAATESKPPEWENAKPYHSLPGPKPIPVLGNGWRFLPFVGDLSGLKTKDLLDELHRRYGPIFLLKGMPGRPEALMLSNPDDIAHVFRNEGQWPIREGADTIEHYMKHHRTNVRNSLAAEQGQGWQEFRTAVNQVMMQPRTVKIYIEPIEQVVEEFLQRIWRLRDDKGQMPDNFVDELAKWSLESITYVALDTRLGALKDDLSPDSETMRMVSSVRDLFECMYKLDFQPSLWKYIPTPAYKKFIKSMNVVSGIAQKHVKSAVERLKALPEEERENRRYSVLERLLLANDDPQKGVAMALDMVLAGVDTTSGVSSSALYHIASHPEKQRKLQSELDRVLPDPNEPLNKEKMEEMKYLRACIKEASRIEPVVVGNSRTTIKDMVIGGYQIPKGTRAVMNGTVVSRNEEYVPRAKEFIPERWLPGGDELRIKHPFASLPFGFGPRMCVGRRFADLEIEILLAKLFRKYTLEWHHPPPETDILMLLRYTSPLKFTMIERK